MDKSERLNIVAVFADKMKMLAKAESCLLIQMSDFFVFNNEPWDGDFVKGFDWAKGINADSRFDLILGDLPLGLNRIEAEIGGKKWKVKRNWVEMVSALRYLNASGLGVFLQEPSAFSLAEGAKFEDALNTEGFFISAIFNAPDKLLEPTTGITPVFVVVSRQRVSSVFVGELLDESQAERIVENFHCGHTTKSLSNGMALSLRSFRGIHQIKVQQQIEKLETQYKEYETYLLGELASEINNVKAGEPFVEKENVVYIPKLATLDGIQLSGAKIKHNSYYQVVLREEVKSGYVAAFFRSQLGRLILDSFTSGNYIRSLNKSDLEKMPIALPRIEDQEQILETQRKLFELKKAIDVFDSELAVNPTSSKSVTQQLDEMLEVIGGLTDIDRVRNLIREGESKNVEFKETFSVDVKSGEKAKYIEEAVLKTIVAFMNTDGGVLLIGVNDAGEISGLNGEINKMHKNTDKFLLHFKNKVKSQIGEGFYPLIEYKLLKIGGEQILIVECQMSPKPCFLNGETFYVRTNPATDKLEGAKLLQYVENHFKS